VCRYRGARLCATDDSGKSLLKGGVSIKFITCPYHAWTYDLDGQLIRARDIPEDCDFNTEDIQLHQVAADSWGGFIFIHMTPANAKPLAEHVALVSERFKRYRMEDLRVGKTLHYTVDANWKVVCENYNECYHCGPVHPELCRIVPAFREKVSLRHIQGLLGHANPTTTARYARLTQATEQDAATAINQLVNSLYVDLRRL
jgi:Rieske 2Fe-2S family protein